MFVSGSHFTQSSSFLSFVEGSKYCVESEFKKLAVETGGRVVRVDCLTNVVAVEGTEVGWAVVCQKLTRIILIIVYCDGSLRQLHVEIKGKEIIWAIGDETAVNNWGEVADVDYSNVGNIGWAAIFDGSGLYWFKDKGIGDCSSVGDLT